LAVPRPKPRGTQRASQLRVRLPVYLFTALLLTLGVVFVGIGVHDAALPRTNLGLTAGSAILLAIGTVLLVGSYRLATLTHRHSFSGRERPACSPVVLFSFILTALLGLYVFFSAIRTPGPQRPVASVAGCAMVLAAAYGLRFFVTEARVTLPRVGTIVLGLVGTTIGAFEVWYQNQYVPARAGRAVELSSTLDLRAHQQRYEVIRAGIAYQGLGRKRVTVIGSTYTLTGSRLVRCERSASAERVQPIFKGFLLDPQRTRFVAGVWEKQPATVLAAGKFVGDGKRLEPSVPSRREIIFHVPRHRYQLLRFRAQLFAIPGSVQLSQRELPEYRTFNDDNYVYGFWHIDDDSWLHDLIYGRERWIVMRYELVNKPEAKTTSPDLRVTARFPTPTWSRGRPTQATVTRLFAQFQPSDASEPFADTELALEPVAEPTRTEELPRSCR
jgi:hypothetical protein